MSKEIWINEFVAYAKRHHIWDESTAVELAEEFYDIYKNKSPEVAASELKMECEA